MPPSKVIIIGGSIAGLLQALQLKRQGSHVIILEQDPSKERQSHESGVAIGKTVTHLLEKYDATGRPPAIPMSKMSFSWYQHLRIGSMSWKHNMSNWGCLYLILRANFDGLASQCVPEPPKATESDGKTEYLSGKQVNGISYDQDKGLVTVSFVDVTTGIKESLSASMVIGADGVHSSVRKILNVPTRKEYSGYIGWRGTVPESQISESTKSFFLDKLTFSLLGNSYLITYFIPTEKGETAPGKRLINFVWYYKVAENSPEMHDIFTDVDGITHPNTVPHGKIVPEIWQAQKDKYLPLTTEPLREVIDKIPRPFVTKVGEAQAEIGSFFDGKLVLVGDAFTGFRSHLGWASEQAARHAVQLDKVWRGEMTMKQRDEVAVLYANRFVRLNRIMGMWGMGWYFSLLWNGLMYLWIVFVAWLKTMV